MFLRFFVQPTCRFLAAFAVSPVLSSMVVLWASLALLIVMATDPSSLRVWALLATAGVIPPALVLRLWTVAPPQTVAELLYETEGRR